MAPKVGLSVNLPTTDPLWTEQRLFDGKDLTPEEQKISKEQGDAMDGLTKSLNQPIQKDDWKGARARVDSLQKQFESLSPQNKKFMYEHLQTKNDMSSLSKDFHYRLSTPSRDALLKTLNPDHKEEHITKYTMADAREKAQKTLEMNVQGNQRQKELEDRLKKKEDEIHKKMEGIVQ